MVPVTLTPFWLRQLLNAARAELLIARPKPAPKPAGAYLAHALNAAEPVPEKDGRERGDPVGRAVGVKDARGRPLNCPGLILTPCCFRHVWNALSPAGAVPVPVALEVAPALGLGLAVLVGSVPLPAQAVASAASALDSWPSAVFSVVSAIWSFWKSWVRVCCAKPRVKCFEIVERP